MNSRSICCCLSICINCSMYFSFNIRKIFFRYTSTNKKKKKNSFFFFCNWILKYNNRNSLSFCVLIWSRRILRNLACSSSLAPSSKNAARSSTFCFSWRTICSRKSSANWWRFEIRCNSSCRSFSACVNWALKWNEFISKMNKMNELT